MVINTFQVYMGENLGTLVYIAYRYKRHRISIRERGKPEVDNNRRSNTFILPSLSMAIIMRNRPIPVLINTYGLILYST